MVIENRSIVRSAAYMLLLLFFVELIRTAWVCDDAFITLRTAMNFLHGYGATFNIDERVQAYTHPLWFLLISVSTAIMGNVYASVFVLSIAFALLSYWLLLREVKDLTAFLFSVLLLFSKAFVDFSTSGLEGPLTHTLLVAGVLLLLKERQTKSPRRDEGTALFLAGLLYLSRPDALLLLLPLVIRVVVRSPHRFKAAVLFALAPFLWTLFSLFYYGFAFPNTAYAKLSTGISRSALFHQGFLYFIDSLSRDPITLMTIAVAVVVVWRRGWVMQSLAWGILLNLLYIVSIGGDFMSGRFLTSALVVSVVLLMKTEMMRQERIVLALPLVLLGLIGIQHTLFADQSLQKTDWNASGIADERYYYFRDYGLVHSSRHHFHRPNWQPGPRDVVYTCGGAGRLGLAAGPSVHLIDPCGLTDPLLSRLPISKWDAWRIGHFERQLPTGYWESVDSGENLLIEPVTREYYEALRKVTRLPLWNSDRLLTILRFNLGMVKRPDPALYRERAVARTIGGEAVFFHEVLAHESDGSGIPFTSSLEVVLPDYVDLPRLALHVQGDGVYHVEFIGTNGLPRSVAKVSPSSERIIETPKESVARRVRITALSGSRHSLRSFGPR